MVTLLGMAAPEWPTSIIQVSCMCGQDGSGGQIALYFAQNLTYSGSWDVYGGLDGNSAGNGSSGIPYFYHTGELYVWLRWLWRLGSTVLCPELDILRQLGCIRWPGWELCWEWQLRNGLLLSYRLVHLSHGL